MYTMIVRDVHTINCLVCKTAHPTVALRWYGRENSGNFSPSTPHNIEYEPEIRSPNCFNLETICGVYNITTQMELRPSTTTRPMDIIFSRGQDVKLSVYLLKLNGTIPCERRLLSVRSKLSGCSHFVKCEFVNLHVNL